MPDLISPDLRRGGATMRLLLALAAVAALLGATAAGALAAPRATPDEAWGANGEVDAVATAGNHVFLGGFFSYVGPSTGSGAILDPTTGSPGAPSSFPHLLGVVRAAVPDGSGGFYVGGDFYRAGGVSRTRLAHIRSDGSLDTTFAPPAPDNSVHALVLSGGVLYVGGTFDQLGSTVRDHLAAVDPTTGALQPFDPDADGEVDAIAMGPDGHTLYAGGSFTHLGGAARSILGAVNTTTGAATSFAPALDQAGNRGYVLDVAVRGTRVYAVGNFDHADGAARGYGAAWSTTDGTLQAFDPQATFVVSRIVLGSGGAYVVDGQDVVRRLDPASGAAVGGFGTADVTDARAIGLSTDGNTLYVSNDLTGAHRGLVAVDATTGALRDAFATEVGDISCADCGVQAIAAGPSGVFAGGGFDSIGGEEANHFAALDATTGALDPDYPLTSWPDPIQAMTVAGTRLVLAGGGAIGAVGTDSGAVDGGWNAAVDGNVTGLAAANGRVYVAGSFDTVAGSARDGLAALAAGTGALDASWAPTVGGSSTLPESLLATGSAIYVGGRFTTAGGAAHAHVAAFDPTVGSVVPGFTAGADDSVTTLALSGSTLYLGGDLAQVDGTARQGAGAVDATTGALAGAFDAQLDGRVNALVASGGSLYVGGSFEHAGATAVQGLATVSATTGALASGTPANLRADGDGDVGNPRTLAFSAGRLLAGGSFGEAAHLPREDLAVFSDPLPFTLTAPVVSANPTAGHAAGCQTGTWTSSPSSYDVAWTVDGTQVATGATYTPTDAQATHQLACRVTAHNGAGASSPATSDQVTILAGPPVSTAAPSISPTSLAVGRIATCATGSWTNAPTSYAYAWSRDGAAVSGATAATYAVGDADGGHALTCAVTAANAAGTSAPATSGPVSIPVPPPPVTTPTTTTAAGAAPVNTARPTIDHSTKRSANPKAPMTLVCAPGAWSNVDPSSYEYRWFQSGVPIGGATTPTLALSHNQVYYGVSLTCGVTGNGPGGSATATSDAYVIDGTCETRPDAPGVIKNDPADKRDPIDYCAQGTGQVQPSQADPVSTRLPLACDTKGGFSYMQVTGCFSTDGTRQTFRGDFSMNGLDFKPVLSTTTVTFDHQEFSASIGEGHKGSDHFAGKVTSQGASSGDRADVEIYAGPVLVYKGPLKWDVAQEAGSGEFELADFDPPTDADVEGFPIVAGKVGTATAPGEGIRLSVTQGYQAKLAMGVTLPFNLPDLVSILGIDDLSSTATLVTDPEHGLTDDSVKVNKADLWIGALHLQNIHLSYSDVSDLWDGGLSINLPFAGGPTVTADLMFQHGGFKGIAVDVSGLNIPVFPLVFLNELRAAFQVDPLFVGGGAGLSIGRSVDGIAPAYVDGNLSYRWPQGTAPGKFHADGRLSLFGVPLESGYFDYYTDDFFDFGFRMEIGLPDFTADEPEDQPVYIGGGVDGWVQWPQFSVRGQVDADLNFIDISVGADVVASSKALAVCGHLGPISGGAAYTWATHDLDLFGGCDIGQYEVPRPAGHSSAVAHAAQAAGGVSVALPGGGVLLKLQGTTAAPRPVVTGPAGQRYVATADAHHPLVNPAVAILEDDKDKVTYVGLKSAKGDWTMTPQPGTSAISGIRSAPLLPDPRVRATITGHGAHRRLSWSVTPAVAGQRLQLAEKTKLGSRPILTTTRARGSVAFAPGPGTAGTRRLVATVVNAQGQPRAQVAAGSYTAPAVPEVAPVARITARRHGTTLTVSWPGVRRAAGYGVLLRGRGLKVGQMLTGRKHRTTFPNLPAHLPRTVSVTIVAVAYDGRQSARRAVTVRLRAK